MPYHISLSDKGNVTIATIKGTIVGPEDRETIQGKFKDLLEEGRTSLILDLGQVTFVDSGGIGGLIAIWNSVMRKSGCMKLLHVTKRMHDVLQITRLSSVFGMYDDLQKALESFESLD